MIRRLAIAGVLLAGLLAPLSAAGPASAGNGVGCTGNDCSVLLSSLITLKGDVGSGGASHVPVNVPPPPCLWEPMGDQATGSQSIINQYPNPDPGLPFGVYASVQQAKKLLANGGPAGTWYMLPVNPAASPAAQQQCLILPLFFFAQPGAALPALPIPDTTLAAFAYNNMLIPAPRVRVNPTNRGYVNLATYVWGTWAPSPTTGRRDAYKITATLGNVTVTVWAQPATPKPFALIVGGPGTAYTAGCGATGSKLPVGRVPATSGAGTPPDCGVLWQAPTTAASVSATVTWTVSWGDGNLNGPGPNALPAITMTGPNPPLAFPVDEIQSVNGG